jgi:L-amino acid N-acyltransferase YncA
LGWDASAESLHHQDFSFWLRPFDNYAGVPKGGMNTENVVVDLVPVFVVAVVMAAHVTFLRIINCRAATMGIMEPTRPTRLRLAAAGDAEGLLAIYAPIVRETAISFELEAPSVEEMQRRVDPSTSLPSSVRTGRAGATLRDLPWLVSESAGRIAGYAYASRHHELAAYRWSVDVSAYVAAEERGKRVGHSLHSSLLGIIQDLGYYTAFAGIGLPNAASVALHEWMGFRPVGVYRNAGYKLGRWHDVGWSQRLVAPGCAVAARSRPARWGRPLREYGVNPERPRAMAELTPEELHSRLMGARQ